MMVLYGQACSAECAVSLGPYLKDGEVDVFTDGDIASGSGERLVNGILSSGNDASAEVDGGEHGDVLGLPGIANASICRAHRCPG